MFELIKSEDQIVSKVETPLGLKYEIVGGGLRIPVCVFEGKRQRKFATAQGGYFYHQNPITVQDHISEPELLSTVLKNLAVFVNDWFIDSDITVKLPVELNAVPEDCSYVCDYVLNLDEYFHFDHWKGRFSKSSKYNRITKPNADSEISIEEYFSINRLFEYYSEKYSYDSVWNSAMNQTHAKRLLTVNEPIVINASSNKEKNTFGKIVSYVKEDDNSIVILGWFGAIDQMRACLVTLINMAFERKISKISFLSGNDKLKLQYKFKPVQCIKIGGTGRFPDLT